MLKRVIPSRQSPVLRRVVAGASLAWLLSGGPAQAIAAPPATAPATTAPVAARPAGSDDRVPQRTVLPPGGRAVVPLAMDEGLPFVDVTVPGGGPARRFILDTGAAVTNLRAGTDRLATSLPAAPDLFVVGGDGRRLPAGRVHGYTVGVGGATFERFDAITVPYAPDLFRRLRAPFAGGLGWPLFTDALLSLDYARYEVTIERGELPPANGADVLPVRVSPTRHLEVQATLDGRDVWLVLDTGSTHDCNVVVGTDEGARLHWLSPPTTTTARFFGGSTRARSGSVGGDLRIGRWVVRHPLVVESAGAEGLLPAATLRHFRVTLDVGHGRLRLAGPIDAPSGCDRLASEAEWQEADEQVRGARTVRSLAVDPAAARQGVAARRVGGTWVIARPGGAELVCTPAGLMVDLVGPHQYTVRPDGGVDVGVGRAGAARWFERAPASGTGRAEPVILNPYGYTDYRQVDAATGVSVTATRRVALVDRPDGVSVATLRDGLTLVSSADGQLLVGLVERPAPAGTTPAATAGTTPAAR